eukprot:CAMPEP_0114240320 /NCGR_PEP_ID=MMETSP0058-20121206/9001_1 /TAXON_ID=36894 /ORGANISM="Pyramimonas parkeae, CCMP726" /LENGTH=136 /DNA_ID=CAMNT_0001352701 /DNA_START=1 /DNA_END=407 /DNA_ORIENTATION=-
MGGSENDVARSVVVDLRGDAYVAGSFNSSAVFGSNSTRLVASDPFHEDAFLMKVWKTGTVDFAIASGGMGLDESRVLAYGQFVNGGEELLYVAGGFGSNITGNATFGRFRQQALSSQSQDAFLMKLLPRLNPPPPP